MKKYIYYLLLSIVTLISLPLFAVIITPKSEQHYYELLNNHMVLVDFYADWCGPCRTLASILRTLHEKHPNLAQRYRLRALPALYFFSYSIQLSIIDPTNKQTVTQIVGLRTEKELETIIKNTYYSKP